jgi:ketosteroid isomerase-like protein
MTDNSKSIDQARIHQLMESQAKSIRAKDIDGCMSLYAREILLFNVVNPLQDIGLDSCRKRMEEWFSSFQGLIGFENFGLTITVGDVAAFCHSINRVNGIKIDGKNIEMFWRSTVCFRKADNKWAITHEHASVPFDVKTGLASLDVKP